MRDDPFNLIAQCLKEQINDKRENERKREKAKKEKTEQKESACLFDNSAGSGSAGQKEQNEKKKEKERRSFYPGACGRISLRVLM